MKKMRLRALFDARISAPLGALWPWSLAGILILFDLPPLHVIDFMNDWVGAKLVMAGKVSHLYQVDQYRRDMCDIVGGRCNPANVQHEFSYPPHILPFILLFGLPAAAVSVVLWNLAGLTGLLAAMRASRFWKPGWPALALAACSPAYVIDAVNGQMAAFTAALFLGGFYLCETSPIVAGVLFGLLTVKPHIGILIPAALLLRRNWACIASACATTLALVAASIALWGIQPWVDYVTLQLPFQAHYLQPTGDTIAYQVWMPGPYADAAFVLGLKGIFAWIPYALAAAVAVFESVTALRREGLTARSILMLALATIIALPYASAYDTTMIMGALCIYLGTRHDVGLPEYLLCGLVWALPLLVVPFKHFHLPFSSVLLVALLVCLGFGSRREGTAQALGTTEKKTF